MPMELNKAEEGVDWFQGCTGLTLVRSSLGLPNSFILQQSLRGLLQHGYTVVLVTAEQSFERYQYALKKTGLALQPYEQSGHLVVLEAPLAPLGVAARATDTGHGASSPAQGPLTADHSTERSKGSSSHCGGSSSSSSSSSALQQLYGAIRQAVERVLPPAAMAPTGVAVILDSLTALACLRQNSQEWSAFLHYCCSGCGGVAPELPACPNLSRQQQQQQQMPYCVVAGVYDDVPDDRPWLKSLEHRANMVVSLEPLPGRIADVDGLQPRGRPCPLQLPPAGPWVTITRRFMVEPSSRRSPTGGSRPPAETAAAAAGHTADDMAFWGPPVQWGVTAPGAWRKSLYFKSSELSVKWVDRITTKELL
ncbi:hypothetical protein VOLCADRAFT_107139 [Volvox carteri f. nagariensis]|uniref:Elongator complex protein 5 n=1 Tax=Volvox carteri f. nagariensis TaxID=3068 RepID=D8UC59_VOLCA|nr:uncharacterized protein VOLCADRAFT_107139 [Volvox carteri f. nagariensis]EFJ42742.1 hypothetical protein VOLCADRAFT_107139 [Volvox carteri f. nagariensis]|eukprot:XP_002956203.1 hypothetical protein VOLCADRAFT_107139 [Volvox carteri f. nagariensis]